MRHTTFSETMAGAVRLTGEDQARPMRLDLDVDLPGILVPWSDLEGPLTGRAVIAGFADDPQASGTIHVAPLVRRRIRYRLDFSAHDGRRLHLDGWKTITPALLRSMTRLPATITDADGAVVGEARLAFDLRRDLLRFLAGFRFPARRAGGRGTTGATRPSTRSVSVATADAPEESMLDSRWRGQPGRLEVWYTTLTDPATGTGIWLHHEMVAPSDGTPARAHGWATVFPPGEEPVFARFGPAPWKPPAGDGADATGGAHANGGDTDTAPAGGTDATPAGAAASGASPDAGDGAGLAGFRAADVEFTAGTLRGTAGDITWDLTATGGGEPLYTFPRWAWERELLPAAQVVPMPAAAYTGTVNFGDRVLELAGAPGNNARIYGHGNAKRWAWLHADLGDGDICEVVAAVSMRPGLNLLPPLPFVRLRVDGQDWPAGDPLVAAVRMRADIDLPTWTVRGRHGDRRIAIEVTQPPAETVAVDYADPDGAPAVCRNTERADAEIVVSRRVGGRWEVERRWRLAGTAHAEVGTRD